MVCHDQCDLTHNSYAQCGEGDAGDRLFMRNNEDTFAGLQSMAELFFYRPELTKHVIQYAEQICGKPSFP